MMSIKNNYFRRNKKTHIDENDRELNSNLVDNKKYSKWALYAGVGGLAISAITCYFTGEPNFRMLHENANQLNDAQVIDSVIFGASSISYTGGNVMYWLFHFLEREHIKSVKNKIRSALERELKENSDVVSSDMIDSNTVNSNTINSDLVSSIKD
jgi:hypothetical protein